jgi:hypothetical protein
MLKVKKYVFFNILSKVLINFRLILFFLLFSISFLVAQSDPTDELTKQLSSLCSDLKNMIPTLAMLLVISGAVIYASGQFFSAETRARANVWATSCITGAIIGLLISQLAPVILSAIVGQEISCEKS